MTPNPVRWFEIYVQDMPRALRFYETVFATRLEQLPAGDLEMWAFPQKMEAPGAAGTLVKAPAGIVSGGNSTLVYFASDDCAVEAARIEAAGGKLYRDKISIGPYGFIALAQDPDGNMFGIHSTQ
ncbi:MAG: VOC family protein [Gammaproteobacteria bacterium]|nr:VOC family protein [Gammaproteobacteria bacterium]